MTSQIYIGTKFINICQQLSDIEKTNILLSQGWSVYNNETSILDTFFSFLYRNLNLYCKWKSNYKFKKLFIGRIWYSRKGKKS